MPSLTRWYIRTSFLYLAAALLVGISLAWRTAQPLPGFFGRLQPVYVHLFLVGWVTQLIFGTVYWLFPKPEEEPFHERVGWITYGLINTGLLLRVVSEPLSAPPGGLWGWVLVSSAVLQWLGGLGFVITTWPRTRLHKKRQRGR